MTALSWGLSDLRDFILQVVVSWGCWLRRSLRCWLRSICFVLQRPLVDRLGHTGCTCLIQALHAPVHVVAWPRWEEGLDERTSETTLAGLHEAACDPLSLQMVTFEDVHLIAHLGGGVEVFLERFG